MNYGMRFVTLYRRQGSRSSPLKRCKKAKWLSGEALQIAVKRREVKSEGEKERYKPLNAEFQRISRRDKKDFLRDQCKEIEKNNRMGKTRDLFKKIRDTKGIFHAKMGSTKDRNCMDLIEAALSTKVRLVKAMVFPVVMYGCESWTVKKAERQRIVAFELWCWRGLLSVPWPARRSNQSILKEISPGSSLEGMILKLKLQYFGHLMRRVESLEKTLMLGGIGDRRRRG